MLVPSRALVATTAGLALAAAGVTACGSSSGSTSTSSSASANQQSNGQPGGGRRGIFSDPKVQECLKKQGVTVPSFRRGNGPPPGGQPPSGSNGSGGTRRRRNFDSSQFQKLRQALQKCGVPGAPPSRSTTNDDTTAS
jgi:hypothetical protein